jgi:hypothetical protein
LKIGSSFLKVRVESRADLSAGSSLCQRSSRRAPFRRREQASHIFLSHLQNKRFRGRRRRRGRRGRALDAGLCHRCHCRRRRRRSSDAFASCHTRDGRGWPRCERAARSSGRARMRQERRARDRERKHAENERKRGDRKLVFCFVLFFIFSSSKKVFFISILKKKLSWFCLDVRAPSRFSSL